MSSRIICFLFIILFGCTLSAAAENLYFVNLLNDNEARTLNESSVEPLVSVRGGYLVLAEANAAADLTLKKIEMSLITQDISKDELALSSSPKPSEQMAFDVVFRDGDFIVFRIPRNLAPSDMQSQSLMPIRNDNLKFYYREPEAAKSITDYPPDLQGLIDQIREDSVQSYTEQLQAFNGRLTGTASNYASRDWIRDKLIDFGYDSIAYDSFTASSSNCQNVIAYKTGTVMPDHYIVVCGHRDAVSGSPGADDNGSGTAGTLEIARVLKDVDTDLSFVFILFDAEEQGLYGSWHYADEAAARGDSIEFVMNMDMIGDQDNSTQAKLYYGAAPGRAQLWQDLADSLVGINGVFMGSISASDHHPFIQNGYEAILLIEYEFSDVYHTYQDSTTHMNFDYHRRMVQASLATVYTIDQNAVPGPTLAFDYPDGYPETVAPGQQTTFEVLVSGLYEGVPLANTGELHYSINGAPYQTASMTMSSANRYTGTIPAVNCDDLLLYYVSAEEATSGVVNNPAPENAHRAIVASAVITAFTDGFETDLGWQVSGGQWQRGTPNGGGGSYGNPDPASAHTGANVYGYNISGDYTNSMPEYHLTTPAIDCSEIAGATLTFWRWLGVEQPIYDHAYIRISTNGTTWTTLWENTAEVADNTWIEQVFDISAYADGQPIVYLRWTMGTTDGAWQYCGWNIDDVEVVGYQCEQGIEPLEIMTVALPDGETYTSYTYQLEAAGGIAPYSWIDKNGDLIGTGLALSANGMLSGMPSSAGDISFMAEVTDDNSTTAEQPYTFTIARSYVCGDANADEEVNVADAVFIINYAFRDGLPPNPLEAGDANCDGATNIADAVYVISYVFRGGPPPCNP